MLGDNRVFEVKFDNYKKYKPLLKIEGEDLSFRKSTYNGTQIRISDKDDPLYQEFLNEVRSFAEQILLENNSDLRIIEDLSCWMVKYRKYGHQTPHKHGGDSGWNIISCVLCFNNTDEPLFVAESNGVTHTSCDYPGLMRIFNSAINVHYTKLATKPRSVIVQDFKVEVGCPIKRD